MQIFVSNLFVVLPWRYDMGYADVWCIGCYVFINFLPDLINIDLELLYKKNNMIKRNVSKLRPILGLTSCVKVILDPWNINFRIKKK